MRAPSAIAFAAPFLVATPAAGQPTCAEVMCTPAISITSHAVTVDDYPAESIRAQEQGGVAVEFVITETGDVAECSIVESSGYPRLDDAACSMIRTRWKYRPATANGNAARQNTTARVVFVLRDAPFTGMFGPPEQPDPATSDPALDIPESYVPPAGAAP